MLDMTKSVFKTGEIAKALRVSPRIVNKWCDSGVLRSYKLPTGAKHEHRRITKASLMTFVQEQRIPIEELSAPDGQVLTSGS